MIRKETIADDVTLYLGDCREILPSLSIAPETLIIADPPYGTGVATNGGLRSRGNRHDPKTASHEWPQIIGDDDEFQPGHLLMFERIVLWGANNYASRLPDSPCWFSWDKKTERGAAASRVGDCELAWTKGLPFKTVRIFRHMWEGFKRDSETGEKHLHPTQKPVALMQWCIGFFPESTTIVDPYMGSGPAGVAANMLGRQFIGIEIEPKYFDIACRRIDAIARQSNMFVGASSLTQAQSRGEA